LEKRSLDTIERRLRDMFHGLRAATPCSDAARSDPVVEGA
jgi:hypothetical protein